MTSPMDDMEGPRACGSYELAGVLDLANLVLRTLNTPAGGPVRPPTVGHEYPHVFHPGNLDNLRVILHRDRVVCAVGIYPTLVRTPVGDLRVGGVCALVTHPDYRRRGLGTAVMEDAQQKMREDGLQVGLLSTLIQDYYRKLGWESGGRQRSFTFDRGNIGLLPAPEGIEITEDWRSRVADLNAIHSTGPFASLRQTDRFRMLMERKANRLFVALDGARAEAYVAMRGTAAVEYAGTAERVAALLRAAFERLDDPAVPTSQRPPGQRATIEMRVLTPEATDGLPGMLMKTGVPHSLGYLGLLKLLDPGRFFESLDVRGLEVSRASSGWRLAYRDAAMDVTERDLVKLVFGPESIPGLIPDTFPVPFYLWTADRV